MNDCLAMLKAMNRPRLLVRAARIGVQDYRRERDLARVLKFERIPGPRSAVMQLLQQEAELEEERANGTSTYSVRRHVQVMIAIMGEAMLITRDPDLKASA